MRQDITYIKRKINNRIDQDFLALEHIWSNGTQNKTIFVDDPRISSDNEMNLEDT